MTTAAPALLHDAAPVAPSRPPCILLVDDSATSQVWVRMILSGTGYALLSARGGREGVERALAERPDLVLMDAAMPGVDGREAARRLREHPTTRHVPVILITTRGDAGEVPDDGRRGDTVTKPIDSAELLMKIRRLLGEPVPG